MAGPAVASGAVTSGAVSAVTVSGTVSGAASVTAQPTRLIKAREVQARVMRVNGAADPELITR